MAVLGESAELMLEAATTCRQVHGTTIVDADRLPPGIADLEADGLTVTVPGRGAAVRTADCVPVLLWAAQGERRWAAAVHAGWRGTLAEIVPAAVRCAARAGFSAAGLEVALGPSIGPCCYEVSTELGERFRAAGHEVQGDSLGSPRSAKPHLDLRAANVALLLHSGVAAQSIHLCGPCTRCRSDLYYSYRADSDDGGRQISWIGWGSRKS